MTPTPYDRAHAAMEADRLGVDYMAAAGFRPSEAVALWRLMAAQRPKRKMRI